LASCLTCGHAAFPHAVLHSIRSLSDALLCRYNLLYADDVGLRLQLLPMLAGFFTYKAGVVGRTALSLVRELRGEDDVGNPAEWAADRASERADSSTNGTGSGGTESVSGAGAGHAQAQAGAAVGAADLGGRAAAAADELELAVDRQVRSL
jgi:hypothetical protein